MALRQISSREVLARHMMERAHIALLARAEDEVEKELQREAAGATVIEQSTRRTYLDSKFGPWNPAEGDWKFVQYQATWIIDAPDAPDVLCPNQLERPSTSPARSFLHG